MQKDMNMSASWKFPFGILLRIYQSRIRTKVSTRCGLFFYHYLWFNQIDSSDDDSDEDSADFHDYSDIDNDEEEDMD
jgi:hypothetical protein